MKMTKKEILKLACKQERKIFEIMIRFKGHGNEKKHFYGKTLDDLFGQVESYYDKFPQEDWDWDSYGMERNWKFKNDDVTLDKLDNKTIQQRLDNYEELECVATLKQKLEFLESIKEFKDIILYDRTFMESHRLSFELSYCDVDWEDNTFKISAGLTENKLSEIEDELLKPIK